MQQENQIILCLQAAYRNILSKCYNDYIHHVEQELLTITKSFLTLSLCSHCQKFFNEKAQVPFEKESSNLTSCKTPPTDTNDLDDYLKQKPNDAAMHTTETTIKLDNGLPFNQENIVAQRCRKKKRDKTLSQDQRNGSVKDVGWVVRRENITKEWNDTLNIDTNQNNISRVNKDHTTNIEQKVEKNEETLSKFTLTRPSIPRNSFKFEQDLKRKNNLNKKRLACSQCKDFYDALNPKDRHVELSCYSKHKSFYQLSSTPLGFWDVDFPKTPPTFEDST
ncbi:uncharacterized protein LOC128884351 [Hylaeus volcanicus]|uniref:uncharacterized protein LOC128884351 n=1 Tax=Hylaeus volcanicus TaxID=313075 RepID=UPI0023B7E412|nr:uncharacterized protein LOC128884351 [Hylaeus volcanicus]